jgi:hypothetical protein
MGIRRKGGGEIIGFHLRIVDIGDSGKKLISVTIVTPIGFEGVVGFFGGVAKGRVQWGWDGVSFSIGEGYKTWMRDRELAKAWDGVLGAKKL